MPLSESEDISDGLGSTTDFLFLFWVLAELLLAGVFLLAVLLADFWFLLAAGVGFLIVTSSSSLSDSLLMDSDSVELSRAGALAFFLVGGGGAGFFFAAAFKK